MDQGLEKVGRCNTSDLKQEFKDLGDRINTTETKFDSMVARTNQNTDQISQLHARLEEALHKIYDLENRSRRYNFRIRGLPESYTDTYTVASALMCSLLPDEPDRKLELDIAHQALTASQPNGPAREIIVKLHFYGTKERVMQKAKETSNIQIGSHDVQIFAAISQATVQKQCSFKPLLKPLGNIPLLLKTRAGWYIAPQTRCHRMKEG